MPKLGRFVRLGCGAALVIASSGCGIFGPAYDWNGPSPTKTQRQACNLACDSEQSTSDRNDAMCHFACESLRNPWYAQSAAFPPHKEN